MKAALLIIEEKEWAKLPDFANSVNENDSLLVYLIDRVSLLMAANDAESISDICAQAVLWFEEYQIFNIK